MPMLFCNIGWAEHYDGMLGDEPRRGGAYNDDNVGHETCNFTHFQGKVFGYVQVRDGGQIRIERLGASKAAESIEGVTVVWTAGPDEGGTAVVGWYTNATVYRNQQLFSPRSKKHETNNIGVYRIVADAEDAVLLPIDDRYDLMIPRGKGGIGQSPIWYADKPESRGTVEMVAAYINDRSLPLTDVDDQQSALEGDKRLVTHLRRERRRHIVEKKKREVIQATGRLCCEACGFDFKEFYGPLGSRFCEVHHRVPLHKAEGLVETILDDLAIMCSNCHRIIHRSNPMLSVEGLARYIKQRRRS
ncbi:HNH endonuclease [Burkholderia sp. Ac-20353]|uniref:HNH endonuclease n=1 Tax=Burkholderia sp. Ac-20353 TaxID=2703894 RepID=UPI001F11F7FA|nr:HNH endonuclease [Burkholderia sp. Ac-20353]MBN3791803.1 HNH endonuclease [Burkholderia sp. Ac-20353]